MVQYASAVRENQNGVRHRAGASEPQALLRPDAEPWLGRIATGLREVMRLQLLAALLHGERSVTELTQLLRRSQPSVSKHLRVLRDQQLVRTRRERNRVFYRIADDQPPGEAIIALLELLERSLPERGRSGRRRNG
ncbi:MAG TPA: metalloregulator ArsR/SmtB family transcription factor [Chloroflexota bacterium]|jgi:DNA-binding transcriptional ArsR family regulator